MYIDPIPRFLYNLKEKIENFDFKCNGYIRQGNASMYTMEFTLVVFNNWIYYLISELENVVMLLFSEIFDPLSLNFFPERKFI